MIKHRSSADRVPSSSVKNKPTCVSSWETRRLGRANRADSSTSPYCSHVLQAPLRRSTQKRPRHVEQVYLRAHGLDNVLLSFRGRALESQGHPRLCQAVRSPRTAVWAQRFSTHRSALFQSSCATFQPQHLLQSGATTPLVAVASGLLKQRQTSSCLLDRVSPDAPESPPSLRLSRQQQ